METTDTTDVLAAIEPDRLIHYVHGLNAPTQQIDLWMVFTDTTTIVSTFSSYYDA